ncbi:MAG TPA: ABC transporter permease [Planctomycetota bacterium]|nr:ABC transporter permease [Planctomycetota bacterium]
MPEGGARSGLSRFRANRLAVGGLALVAALALASLAGPPILWAVTPTHTTYQTQFPGEELSPPSAAHPLGTDRLGFDVLARLLWGGMSSLLIALAATAIALVIALAVGLTAGYAGGWIDAALMRLTDTFFAFPSILLAMVLVAAVDRPSEGGWLPAAGKSMILLFVALGATGWTGLARLIRAQVLTVRGAEYVNAARALGLSPARIALRHVLPNCLGPVAVAATLAVGSNLLGEAGLSFLGLGVVPPFPSWGSMLNDSRAFFAECPWLMAFPGLAITLAVLGFNLAGDGLRDALDPRTASGGAR